MHFALCILLSLFRPAAAAAAAKPPGDPFAEAGAAASKRQYIEAISKALSVASSAKEPGERRGKAFELVAQCYLDMGFPRLAIATYHQSLVALGRDDPNALAAWWRIAAIHVARQEYHEAIAHLEKATAELDLAKLPAEARVKLPSDLAACREQVGQLQGALSAYETLFSVAQKGDAIGPALAKAARLYAELHRFDKALGCLDRLYGKLEHDTVVSEAARAYHELAQKLPAAGRTEEADALDRKIISLFCRKEPSSAKAALLRLLGGEDDAATLKLAGTLQENELRLLAQDEVLETLMPAALRLGRAGELVSLLTRAMLAEPFDETTSYACSSAIVKLRFREGRFDDALAVAYTAYAATGFGSYVAPQSFGRAVDLVTDALRARDGHLVSGNVFRLYQAYGPAGADRKPGTADDLANPVATLAAKPDPERDKLFEAAIARFTKKPRTVAGHRACGWLYLLWGKPKNALSEFKRAFALCSLETTELARAAQDIALGLKALHATPVGMEAFAEFQRHGPNGADGKPKTADDLKDPLEGL
ncbi:MAG TPA: tetratricopeptide repeat protein [Planctomycetota bacterium]|nr:tetratricopeptide repeat protein [Planctomycetota bacterium]